jgi:hypothetical protein
MKRARAILLTGLLVLASCATTENSIYQSVAPEVRGERAISSAIELASEVDLETSLLGVFYSKEIYQDGQAQNLLFTLRAKSFVGSKAQGRVTDYSLRETSSLSVDQGRKFLVAIEEYLAKDPASLKPAQMFNFELYSGTLDMTKGYGDYHPLSNLTFMVICSVTTSGKSFKTVFPVTSTTFLGVQSTSYTTYNLTPAQVQKLRDAIKAGLDMASPEPAPAGGVKPST